MGSTLKEMRQAWQQTDSHVFIATAEDMNGSDNPISHIISVSRTLDGSLRALLKEALIKDWLSQVHHVQVSVAPSSEVDERQLAALAQLGQYDGKCLFIGDPFEIMDESAEDGVNAFRIERMTLSD